MRRPCDALAAAKRRGLAPDRNKPLAGQADNVDFERGRMLIDRRLGRESQIGDNQASAMEENSAVHAD